MSCFGTSQSFHDKQEFNMYTNTLYGRYINYIKGIWMKMRSYYPEFKLLLPIIKT